MSVIFVCRICAPIQPAIFVLSIHPRPILVKLSSCLNRKQNCQKRTNYFRIIIFTAVLKLDQKNHICVMDPSILRNIGLKW